VFGKRLQVIFGFRTSNLKGKNTALFCQQVNKKLRIKTENGDRTKLAVLFQGRGEFFQTK